MLRETKTRWLQAFHRKPASREIDRPTLSLTFDDVPISAFRHGVPLLAEHQARATFYVCLGLPEAVRHRYLGHDEVRALHRSGHEIGCHSLTHYRLSEGSVRGLAADARENRRRVCAAIGNDVPLSFSFPYGELSWGAKRTLTRTYQSLRSTRPGLNAGRFDLNCLRAQALRRDHVLPRTKIGDVLKRVREQRAWLILYTHGVSDRPSDCDITPGTLALWLEEARRQSIHVSPVGEVVARLDAGAALEEPSTRERAGSLS